MSFLFAQPQMLMAAATDLAGIGSTLNAANTAAALPTTSVLAAGADEVSAAMASMFGAHARQYQAMSAQAANLHSQFVQAMNSASGAYASAEAANASPLQVGGGAIPSTINTRAPAMSTSMPASMPASVPAFPGGAVGNTPRTGQVGSPARSAVSNGANARSAVPGRVGGAAGPIPRGGVGGVGVARRANEKKQAPTHRPSRNSEAAATFGPGGAGGVGDARDLRATYEIDGNGAAPRQSFRNGGIGAASIALGRDGLRRAS
jgi:hypothetical protein